MYITYPLLKKIATPVTAVVAVIVFASFTLLNGASSPGTRTAETITCFGPSVTTHSLHNSMGCACTQYEHKTFANALFAKHVLTLKVQPGFHFTGKPYVHCVIDDQGSFAWNNFQGSPDRFIITRNDGNYIEAIVWAGSRQITINLACEATKN